MDKAPAQTKGQNYVSVLGDIAMAMAIKTLDPDYKISASGENYTPGSIRELWIAETPDKLLRMRVTPLATAGTASLQTLSAEQLLAKANEFGVPLSAEFAEEIATYFDTRRARVMTYDR